MVAGLETGTATSTDTLLGEALRVRHDHTGATGACSPDTRLCFLKRERVQR
jgi:hypothetical protein